MFVTLKFSCLSRMIKRKKDPIKRKFYFGVLSTIFLCRGDPVFSESLCKELQKKFFQQRCELGKIGRKNMNRMLNLDISQNNTFLLPRDLLAAVDHLIGMKLGIGNIRRTSK
ncbi:DNA-directed RNA polymerase subunit beta [Platanthera zijinensis]|uniref:DNA-directed RNA polymerase n=1 Tax=Platanthera zijinensis TaxID=2320716 RepID=A0AAP0BFK1_9ASPA